MNKILVWFQRFVVFLLLTRIFSLPHTDDDGHVDSDAARILDQEQSGDHQIHCSRERSRIAWKIVQEYLTPFVDKEKYNISRRCRLHPDNDIYRDQEQHKSHIDINEWQCGYCKKTFYEEKHLDQHFDNRHSNLLNLKESRCLADVCGALHCDHEINSGSKKSKCNPAAAARNKHICETIADSCFPVNEGPAASRLHEFFLHQFCDAHSCTGRGKPFSRGRRKKTNVFYIVASIFLVMLLRIEKGKSNAEACLTSRPKKEAIIIIRSFPLEALNLFFQKVTVYLTGSARTVLHLKSSLHFFCYLQVKVGGGKRPHSQLENHVYLFC